MTPDIQQGRDGYPRSRPPRRDADAVAHQAAPAADAPLAGHWGAAARPVQAFQQTQATSAVPEQAAASSSGTEAGHMREDRSIVGFVPYLAVLVCAVVGVYIAWRDGSAGGGDGAAVLGAALLAAAVARLLLPARLARLLATRKRATDVLTLAVFGLGLLVLGLVLPR
ncbi:DUF3017 domain-containing protein [Trebonia kvetii]|nr:DUF3017 domain-containing protein [Trebonia kvetii]